MLAKIHSMEGKQVLAVCDKELIGKTLKTEKINFTVYESFYGGFPIDKKELVELISENSNVNLVGKKCVSTAQGKGLLNESSILFIGGVPHAQIFKLNL